MSRNLTKNARWIVVWLKIKSPSVTGIPAETVCNIGRHPYSVPAGKAIYDSLDINDGTVLSVRTYLVDVALCPYAKDWKRVSEMAEKYFKRERHYLYG